MMARFAEAFRLLWKNFGLFTAIVLTVWLPASILLNYVTYYSEAQTSTLRPMRMSMWIDSICSPLYIGALVFALFQIKSGRKVTYREAIAVGFRKWGSLFVARFIAGILVFLAMLALLVPGMILAVRYSLLDEV